MKDNIIMSLNDIEKKYNDTNVLSEVCIDIHKGEALVISGPSGSGKSTLLNVLGLLLKPDTGTYKIDGIEISNLSMDQLAEVRSHHIGFVFQSFHLIEELSIFDNVALPLTFRNRAYTRAEIRNRVTESLERVGLKNKQTNRPSELSGGQQQRVAIARAIVGKPTLLLADEPTGNLDSNSADSVMNIFDELISEGSTVCLVTHDRKYIDRFNNVYNMLDGRIIS